MIQFWGMAYVPFCSQSGESQLVALCQLPLTLVCKSQHLVVHRRLVNMLSCIGCGSLTSGKTFSLKYCLSSSSMSALGLQDNICSLHVPKTWQPACALRQLVAQTHHPMVTVFLAASFPSLLLCSLPLNSGTEADGRKLQEQLCLKSALTLPHLPPHLRH